MIRISYEKTYPDGIHCYVYYSQYSDFTAAYHEFIKDILNAASPSSKTTAVCMELCRTDAELRRKRIPRNAVCVNQESFF